MLYCSIAAIFFAALLRFFTLIYCVTWMLAEVISTCESFTEYSHVPTSIIMRSVFWGKSVTRFCLLNQFTNQQAAKVGLLSFNDNYNKPSQSLCVPV